MGTKRAFSAVHPERRDQVPTESRKRQKPDNLGAKSYKKARPVNDLKTRVRDLSRLLARADDKLPASVRIEKERELQSTRYELEETQNAERRNKMISRYHKIRFFDRQKATKKLKRLKKQFDQLEEDDSEKTRLEDEIVEAEVDINYAIYYPLDKAYVALFPKTLNSEGDNAQSDAKDRGDQEMRNLVKKCMKDKTLDRLRNGKLTAAKSEPQTMPVKRAKAREKKTTAGATNTAPDNKNDDDSDGGFFEF